MFKKLLLILVFVLLSGCFGWLFYYLAAPGFIENYPPIKGEQDYIVCDFDIPDSISFAGERVPVDLFYISERLDREILVNTYWHSSMLLNLKRAERWFPIIEPILAKNGIPDDFKYLAMTESGLTNAVSPAGAVGFWQFLSATAKEYGLEVNKEVDMRYNVELETVAACKYFLKSYKKYKNWALVAAAYNAGNKRVDTFLSQQKVNSYFDLLMAEETERYLFRMIAMKMITENPEQYGFFVKHKYPLLQDTTVIVDKTIDDWADFAQEKGITYKLLKYYNPWLRSTKLTISKGNQYEIKLPLHSFNLTNKKLQELYQQ